MKTIVAIGAKGVGKTTVLSQVCAKFVAENKTPLKKIRVILMSSDFSAEAKAELGKIADVANLTFPFVQNFAELKSALGKSDFDLTIVDTKAYNETSDELLCLVSAVKKTRPEAEIFLVIDTHSDIKASLQSFEKLPCDKVVLAKCDRVEKSALDNAINAIHENGKTVPFISVSEKVSLDALEFIDENSD